MGREEMKFLGGHPVSVQELLDVERHLNIHLPKKFREISLVETDGHPEKGSFVCEVDSRKFGSYFGGVVSFSFNDEYNVIKRIENVGFEKGLIPFGITGFGDYICFDYRADSTTDDPPVVYWAHEFADVNDGLVPLAPNFEAFLGMLMSEEEAEAALAKANGKA